MVRRTDCFVIPAGSSRDERFTPHATPISVINSTITTTRQVVHLSDETLHQWVLSDTSTISVRKDEASPWKDVMVVRPANMHIVESPGWRLYGGHPLCQETTLFHTEVY